jgi:hypothetical protein
MDADAPRPIVQRDAPDLWRLPEILELHVRWRRFDPPKRVTIAGKDTQVTEAVEIEIRVSEPFQIRALGPSLWVGDVPLTVADSPRERVYRFYAFTPDQLRPDAPIALSWYSPGAPRHETKYRYAPPKRE